MYKFAVYKIKLHFPSLKPKTLVPKIVYSSNLLALRLRSGKWGDRAEADSELLRPSTARRVRIKECGWGRTALPRLPAQGRNNTTSVTVASVTEPQISF